MSELPAGSAEHGPTDVTPPDNTADGKGVLLVPYPNFVFFYPTAIAALIAGVWLYFLGDDVLSVESRIPVAIASVFLTVFALNLVVIVFDFPRTTSLMLVFIITTLGLATWLLLLFKPSFIPFLASVFSSMHPVANSTFYLWIAAVMTVMYGLIYVSARFDYWELRANELIHHHGLWSNMKRYPAPNLRIDKEINDVFEHLMLGSGRLVLRPSTEDRAIILDNILFVNRKEEALTKKLGSLKVRIQSG